MKASLFITACIIGATLVFGFRNQRSLAAAEAAHLQATLLLGGNDKTINSPVDPFRTRIRPAENFQTLSADLFAFIRELEASDGKDNDHRQSLIDWQRRLASLPPALMERLIGEIASAPDIGDEARQDMLHLLFQSLAENHPAAALELLAREPSPLEGHRFADAAALSLLRLIQADSDAAVKWYHDHRSLLPGRAGNWVTECLLRHTSLIDPDLAFTLIDQLGVSDSEYAIRMITNPARTTTQRDATLAALRRYLDGISDPAEREKLAFEGTSSLISTAGFDGAENGLRWVESAGFTTSELENYFGRHIPDFPTSEEAAVRLNWMVKNLSNEAINTFTIPTLVSGWAYQDHQAAGDWLEKVPEGPAKVNAVAAYVGTLAPHLPETASRWLETLSPGEKSESLIRQIHRGFLKSDPTAAASFALKYSIDPSYSE